MDKNPIESTFCFKYLIKCIGLKRSTIESLVANDYDSIHSLMALNLDIDLQQLPNISMGQKSILRESLIQLKIELNNWRHSETDSKAVSPLLQNVLNSTPIIKAKEYPHVSNDQLFKELITTALMDTTVEFLSEPLKQNVSSDAVKQLVDSSLNGTDFNGSVELSPIKTSLAFDQMESSEIPETSENQTNDQNSKQSFDKSVIRNKSKRKRKKFLYSLKTSRKRNQRTPKSKPLSEKQSNCQRMVFIDIDKHSKDSMEEEVIKEVVRDGKDSKFEDSADSDLSAEELDNGMDIVSERQTVRINGNPKKRLEELLKLVSLPNIFVDKMNVTFDKSKNKYLTYILDTEFQSSPIVINNYDHFFKTINKTIDKRFDKTFDKTFDNTNKKRGRPPKPKPKPYKCSANGCFAAFEYPFSLDQHMVRHNKKSPPKEVTNSTKKSTPSKRESSILQGMNNYVINYMKNTSAEDSVLSSETLNFSIPFVGQTSISEYSSDYRLFRPNIECIFNNTNDQNIDNNINDKIVTKIKDWFKTEAIDTK